MCIAILNKRSQLSAATINTAWENNPEGGGLIWIEKGQLKTFKTYDRAEMLKTYQTIRHRTKQPIVLHFRIATSGARTLDNLHPFLINKQTAFVHNGVIAGLGNETHSDTAEFNLLLQKLPANFLESEALRELIAGYIGYSKLVFLQASGTFTIVNEHAGQWDNDTWYSNDSHKESAYYYYGTQKIAKQPKQGAKVKTKAAPIISPQEYNRQAENELENMNYLRSYFTGVTYKAAENIADALNCETHDVNFLWEVEDAARLYSTYDLEELERLLISPPQATRSQYTYDLWND
jgi:hypothetical protein